MLEPVKLECRPTGSRVYLHGFIKQQLRARDFFSLFYQRGDEWLDGRVQRNEGLGRAGLGHERIRWLGVPRQFKQIAQATDDGTFIS